MEKNQCFVYFVGYDRFIKIGHTINLRRRMIELQNASPHKLELYLVIYYDSRIKAVRDEKRLHSTYKKQKVRGEWFENIDLENEWTQIHALTYAADKYKKYIDFNEGTRICNDVFSDEPESTIPKQDVPLSEARSSRNSSEVIYHLLLLNPKLRSGSKHYVNDLLDFPVSSITIGNARRLLKKYLAHDVPVDLVPIMLYVSMRPNVSNKELRNKFRISHTSVEQVKKYAKIHMIAKNYYQNTYE